MSYERSQRRYVHPYDMMEDAINRMNEAFYALSNPMMMPWRFERPYSERQMLGRSQEASEKQVQDKGKTPGSESTSAMQPMFERSLFKDPFFKSNWENEPTFDRAYQLLDEMVAKGKPNVDISQEDELLKVPEDMEKLFRESGDKPGSKLSGESYQTSTITRDGKTVTVEKKSKLHPDGKLTTKVSQHFEDAEGHRNTMTRKKIVNFKTGEKMDKVLTEPEKAEMLKSSEESLKTPGQETKEEKISKNGN